MTFFITSIILYGKINKKTETKKDKIGASFKFFQLKVFEKKIFKNLILKKNKISSPDL